MKAIGDCWRRWAVLLCLFMVAANGAAAEDGLYYVAVSSTSYANVREQPNTESKIITTLDRGAEITATGATNGLWVEVKTDSVTITYHEDGSTTKSEPRKGWIMLSLLSEEEPYSDVSGVVAGDGRVRLRDEPGGGFAKWMQPGDKVGVLAVLEVEGARWYRVRHGEDRGWMLADYLEIT